MSNPESASPAAAQEPPVFDPADRLHICTPAYGCVVGVSCVTGLLAAHDQALARFRGPDGATTVKCIIGNLHLFGNESHIDRARNRLVDIVLKGDLNKLFFLDADIEFTPTDLLRVWMHSIANPRAIICGPYATKSIVPSFALHVLPGEKPDPQTGLVKAGHAGTGFMLIPRQLFADLVAQDDAPAYHTGANDPNPRQTMRAYFQSGVAEGPGGITAWLSEDYNICQRARALGYDILVDRSIELGHWGMQRFPVPAKEIFAAAKVYRSINHPDCPPEKV